jgi:predicted PurR-regulated permease PerM
MSKDIINNQWFNIIITILVVITFIVFNYEFRTALLIGFVLAVLTYPVAGFFTRKLEKYLKSYSKPISIILTMVFVTLLTGLLVNFVAGQIVKEIPNLASGVQKTVNELPTNQNFLDTAKKYGISEEFVDSRVSEFNNLKRR